MSIVLLARDLGLSIFENGRHIGQSLLRLLRGDAKPADIHYLEPVVLVPRKSDGPSSK